MNDLVTDEWVSFVIGCSPKRFSSLAGLKVALGLKKKKSKGWEDIYHAIHHQTFLKSQCQQVEANDAIIFPFNMHSAYLVQCRVQGRGFSWDFMAEIMQLHFAKIQVEAFFTQFSGTNRLLLRLWQKQEREHFCSPLSKSQARQKDKRDQGANQEKWMAI